MRLSETWCGRGRSLASRWRGAERGRARAARAGGSCARVRDMARARRLPAIAMKGISREVVPYAVEGLLSDLAQRPQVISEHATGLDFFLDLEAIDDKAAERAKQRLAEALLALTDRESRAGAG